jgi:hypothetical protein
VPTVKVPAVNTATLRRKSLRDSSATDAFKDPIRLALTELTALARRRTEGPEIKNPFAVSDTARRKVNAIAEGRRKAIVNLEAGPAAADGIENSMANSVNLHVIFTMLVIATVSASLSSLLGVHPDEVRSVFPVYIGCGTGQV